MLANEACVMEGLRSAHLSIFSMHYTVCHNVSHYDSNNMVCYDIVSNIHVSQPGLRSRSRSWSRSRPESVVLTGVGVGVGVGKFSSTPTPARSRLQHFFIISFLVKMETKMETEHYVLTADGHDGLSCTVLLALELRLFLGLISLQPYRSAR